MKKLMKKILIVTAVMAIGGFGLAEKANANIIWNWSFASEAGQFVTDGDSPIAGTYTMMDFSVTSSATGGTLGSLSGGNYATNAFSTYQPFSFDWDGSEVTKWNSEGFNTFDWWVFRDVAIPNQYYFFGWDTGNINDVTRGAHYDSSLGDYQPLAVGDIHVYTPEPATMSLLGIGTLSLIRRKK